MRLQYLTVTLLAVSLALGASASPVYSAGPERDRYVKTVEPICRAATVDHGHILRGVEELVRRGKLTKAAVRFKRAANVLAGVVGKLAKVPRPPADAERLAKWLRYGTVDEGLLRKISRTLEEGSRAMVPHLASELLRETKRANAVVVGFGFNYCRLKPDRFA